MYELLLICLTLSALLTVNALMSLVTAAAGRLVEPALRKVSAGLRAEILFTLRICAPAISIVAIAAVFVPSFLAHEPYGTKETVGFKLGLLAFLSVVGVGLALSRAMRSWLATRSLLQKWLGSATQIQLGEVPTPTFRLPHAFPIIAVVGTLRPRLFIAEHVLQSLSGEELKAAIAHECGHVNARDNLKRTLLRACRDVLMLIPCGRSLDRAWAEAAECAADEHAAKQSSETALNLASSLVKIAKMIPAGGHAAMPVAVFLVGEESRGVKARVRRLLDLASNDHRRRNAHSNAVKILPALAIFSMLVAGISAANHSPVLINAHNLIEHVVHLLS
ncbi:MAG TPA: M48 family metalloprotease [Pyrinomonadaceae bacterium]|nr:M48 family metalloprotease [Pyrinomonadaceae bacterium]